MIDRDRDFWWYVPFWTIPLVAIIGSELALVAIFLGFLELLAWRGPLGESDHWARYRPHVAALICVLFFWVDYEANTPEPTASRGYYALAAMVIVVAWSLIDLLLPRADHVHSHRG
jgi:hypothetical protein